MSFGGLWPDKFIDLGNSASDDCKHNSQAGMNGNPVYIKLPKSVLRSLLPLWEGMSLPEEMFMDCCARSQKILDASLERVSPFKL